MNSDSREILLNYLDADRNLYFLVIYNIFLLFKSITLMSWCVSRRCQITTTPVLKSLCTDAKGFAMQTLLESWLLKSKITVLLKMYKSSCLIWRFRVLISLLPLIFEMLSLKVYTLFTEELLAIEVEIWNNWTGKHLQIEAGTGVGWDSLDKLSKMIKSAHIKLNMPDILRIWRNKESKGLYTWVHIHEINYSKYLLERVRIPNSRFWLVLEGDEMW